MATDNRYNEYTSLLQGYRSKRKKKKKKVIAAAALTFIKNLADKTLSRRTTSELASYKSEYERLNQDALGEYKKQENFINIGTTRGGGDYTYSTSDDGVDTINFQYPDKIKESFIVDEIENGRKLLNTQFGTTRSMDKKYVEHLTKIGEQRYQNWQDNKGAYDFSIRSEADATEGIRKALLLTAKEYTKPRYADAITNLGYKWFNKEVQNPALLELAKVKNNLASLKSSREANIKGIDSVEYEGGNKISELNLSMAQRAALEKKIEDGTLQQEGRITKKGEKIIPLTINEQVEAIATRYKKLSILQAFGFSSPDQILGSAITPVFDLEKGIGSRYIDPEKTSSKDAVFKREYTKEIKNIFTDKGFDEVSENIINKILTDDYESISQITPDPETLRDIKIDVINKNINIYRDTYGYNDANQKTLEYAKFKAETEYLKSKDYQSPDYFKQLEFIKAMYDPFLKRTTAQIFSTVKASLFDKYSDMNQNELQDRSKRWLDVMDYVISHPKNTEQKEKLEQLKNTIVTSSGAIEYMDVGLLQTLDAIEEMNIVYSVQDLNNKDLHPYVDSRPEEWQQLLVEASLGLGRYGNN